MPLSYNKYNSACVKGKERENLFSRKKNVLRKIYYALPHNITDSYNLTNTRNKEKNYLDQGTNF